MENQCRKKQRWLNDSEHQERRPHTGTDFEIKFLECFWGTDRKQEIIKNELYEGKFDYNKGNSYQRYDMQIYSTAQIG